MACLPQPSTAALTAHASWQCATQSNNKPPVCVARCPAIRLPLSQTAHNLHKHAHKPPVGSVPHLTVQTRCMYNHCTHMMSSTTYFGKAGYSQACYKSNNCTMKRNNLQVSTVHVACTALPLAVPSRLLRYYSCSVAISEHASGTLRTSTQGHITVLTLHCRLSTLQAAQRHLCAKDSQADKDLSCI